MKKQIQKELRDLDNQMSLENRKGDLSRARSVTVGTCFGGTSEIMMRGNNGYMWATLQPVEVVELINQLAANIGCHISIKPKKDFASWREWRLTEEEWEHLNGHPPFVNDMAPFMQVGSTGMDPELDKTLVKGGKIIEFSGGEGKKFTAELIQEHLNRSKENVVATEKPKNRRNFKRTTKAT